MLIFLVVALATVFSLKMSGVNNILISDVVNISTIANVTKLFTLITFSSSNFLKQINSTVISIIKILIDIMFSTV